MQVLPLVFYLCWFNRLGFLNDLWMYSISGATTSVYSEALSTLSKEVSTIHSTQGSSQQSLNDQSSFTPDSPQSSSESINIIDNDNISNTTIIDGIYIT